MLVDGARALARSGRWTEAADTMAAHRGIGNRLLDGRQIMIMSLVEQDLTHQATEMIDSSVPAEPWEKAVAAILRVCCRPSTSPAPQKEVDHAVNETLALIAQPPEPMTTAFRVRIGLTALDLTSDQPSPDSCELRAAVLNAASSDAYGARDVLGHPVLSRQITHHQEKELAAVLTASGLGTRHLPAVHMEALTTAVSQGEDHLRSLLGLRSPITVGQTDPTSCGDQPESRELKVMESTDRAAIVSRAEIDRDQE